MNISRASGKGLVKGNRGCPAVYEVIDGTMKSSKLSTLRKIVKAAGYGQGHRGSVRGWERESP